jgi:hypothetical protein
MMTRVGEFDRQSRFGLMPEERSFQQYFSQEDL